MKKLNSVTPGELLLEEFLKPGARFRVIDIGCGVELIPIRPIEEYRGILKGKGIGTDIEREDDRFEATLWTQDDDFEGLPNVRYFAK